MILIVCENTRTAKNVALAMGANTETAPGIYTSDTISVATVPEKFIRQTPLEDTAEDRYPYLPEKFRMSVTMKELERDLKPLFREAAEVVFASDGGADAQARFFNICRHFRVGCPTSRMWLTRLCYGAIRGAFHFRESGRHLYRLAQTGLVSKGMDMLFEYNIRQAFIHIGLPYCDLTRQEAIALEHIGDIANGFYDPEESGYSIQVNVNRQEGFESQTVWEDEAEAGKVLSAISVGNEIPATMTISETTAYNIRFHTLLTLQMDAYNNLGFTPAKTAKVAQSLYERGLISSPLTSCSHLPVQLRGHIETVFGVTDGYQWGENEATLNSHAIITLRRIEEDLTASELQLYWLIFNRMKAVVEQQPTRKYAVVEFTVGDTVFSRQWELTGEAYEVTENGVFDASVVVRDAAVYPCDMPPAMTTAFTDVLCSLTSKAEYADEIMHTNVPFTKSTSDYGSVISKLIDKGLVSDEDGDICLTPEGQYIHDEFVGNEFGATLLTWQFEANDLYEGESKGRSVMDGFSGSLLRMVELIDPETTE